MLTFERNPMLGFAGVKSFVDFILNYLVVAVALALIILNCSSRDLKYLIFKNISLVLFVGWVSLRLLIDAGHYNPNSTTVISVLAGIIISLNISRSDLPILRRSLLVLSFIFSIMIIAYVPSIIFSIGKNDLGFTARLGEEYSPYYLIAFPRTVYIIVIACVGSFVAEKNVFLKISSVLLMFIPLIIGFSIAGRGPFLGLVFAMSIIIIGTMIMHKDYNKIYFIFILLVMIFVVYYVFKIMPEYFPLFLDRITLGDDSGRFSLWEDVVNYISLFGMGAQQYYAHNLFLECVQNYGILGLLLLLSLLYHSFLRIKKGWQYKKDIELLVLMAIIALQIVSQQFSLDIFTALFWTAIVLPLNLDKRSTRNVPVTLN